MIVSLNGDWIAHEKACIPITDRGFLFSDGVFETARLHQGKYFRLSQHLGRLQESARMLALTAPASDELARLAREIADFLGPYLASGLQDIHLYAVGEDVEAEIEAAGEIRRLLNP